MINLRDYQLTALDAIWNDLFKNKTSLCVLPTGSGKSELFFGFIEKAYRLKNDVKIVILLNKADLLDQTVKRLKKALPDISVSIYSGSKNEKDTSGTVIVSTIQSIYNKKIDGINCIICDEAHNIGGEDGGRYIKFIRLNDHEKLKVLGFTATPYRANDGYIYGDDKFFKTVGFKLTMSDIIEKGFLVKPIAKKPDHAFDTSNIKIKMGDFDQKQLGKLVSDVSKIKLQINDALPRLEGRKKIVWACVNINHAEDVCRELNLSGEKATLIHSKLTMEERVQNKKYFEEGEARHLVFVTIVSEGYDYKSIDAVILMRPTRSPVLYVQCLDSETEILSINGFKKIEQIKKGDKIMAFDMHDHQIKPTTAINVFIRDTQENEYFYSTKTPQIDIRVTGGHRMITSSKNGGDNKIELAENIKSDRFIPVSGNNHKKDLCGLSDHDISFIGWVMTDGSINKRTKQIVISQSSNSPFLKDIEDTLNGCNFKYGVQKINSKSNFKRNGYDNRFYVSYGKPRSNFKEKTGWSRIEKFIDKDFSDILFSLSERQFDILIESIHKGDGHKQLNQSWNRRSYHITKGNKTFTERLQVCAIMNGYATNITTIKPRKKGYKEQYTIHLKKITHRFLSVTSKDGRCNFKKEQNKAKEKVWCLENKYSTLIIRRNGKTAIVGNCLGRGLRPSEGKENCLVLDYGEVVENLGPVDDPYIRKKGERKINDGKMLQKVCPECRSYNYPAARTCAVCDFSFVKDVTKNLTIKAANISLLKDNDEEKDDRIYENEIVDIDAMPHKSSNGNECVKIVYRINNVNPRNVCEYFTPKIRKSENAMVRRLVQLKVDLNKFDRHKYYHIGRTAETVLWKKGKYITIIGVK